MKASHGARLLLGGLLALVLLYFFFRGIDWSALGGAFRSAHRGYLVGVLAATVFTYLCRAWRWGALLQPLARVPFRRLLPATVVGFMTGLLIPRAGEVVRPYLIARGYRLKTSAAFATIILERLVDLITVIFLFGAYLYVLPAPPRQTSEPLIGPVVASLLRWAGLDDLASVPLLGPKLAYFGVLLAALAVLLALSLLHARPELAMGHADRILARLPARAAAPLGALLRSFREGLAVLRAPLPHLLLIFGQSLLIWLSIAAGIWFNGRAFGLDLPFHSAFLIIGFLTVGVAVPTPGMVGGFHESYLLALTQAYHVDKQVAAAAGLMLHALSNLPVLIVGLLWLRGSGLTMGQVADMTDKAPEDKQS